MKRSTILASIFVIGLSGALIAAEQVPGVNSTLNTVFTLAYDNATSKPTYSATTIINAATAFDDVCLLNGSATKTIRVRRVILSGRASVVQTDPVSIVKRSTVPNSGAGGTITSVGYSSGNAAATAVMEYYTTSPTPGTLAGVLADVMFTWANTSTGVGQALEYKFGELGSSVFLRGAAQSITVNLGGTGYTSGQLSCTFEWTEDTDS